MTIDEKSSGWGGLLTAAKVLGAVATIGGVVLGAGGWVFSAVMAERDNKIQDLQGDIDGLSANIAHLSSQIDESEERFTNLRIAMELLNARLELRTADAGAPPPAVRVRARPPRSSVGAAVPVGAHTDFPVDHVGVGPPLLGRDLPPPAPEERVFHTDHDAEEAFNQALADVGGSL